MYRELGYNGIFLLALGAVGAGTGDVQTFTEVDMAGLYDSLVFVAMIGTVTSTGVATLTAKNSSTSGTYGSGTVDTLCDPQNANAGLAAGIASASLTTGASNEMLILDLYRLPKRYVQGQIQRATANVVISSVLAIAYNAKQQPTSNATTSVPTTGLTIVSNPVPSTT